MTEYAEEEDYYAADPVSDEEKLTIAEHMLMSSPPGQFCDVLKGECGGKVTRNILNKHTN